MWWRRQIRRKKASERLRYLLNGNPFFLPEIHEILELYPEVVCIQDGKENLPLHIYCAIHNSDLDMSVVQALVNKYPESLKMTNKRGESPLYLVCRTHSWHHNVGVIRFLVEEYPDAILASNNIGKTPLEAILSMKDGDLAPELVPTIQFMLDACPDGAKVLTSNHQTLMHVVCRNLLKFTPISGRYESYISLIRLLIQAFPESINAADQHGILPLHVLCRMWCPMHRDEDHKVMFRQVLDIMSNSPHCRRARDYSGQTPLHLLCSQEAPQDVIMVLLEKDHSLAGVRDSVGRTPLHYVLDKSQWQRNAAINPEPYYDCHAVICSLIESWPLGAYKADYNGVTPLQFAHENNLDLSYVFLLVRTDPLESLSSLGVRR